MSRAKDYQYTLLSQIEGNTRCHVYGVVAKIAQQSPSTEIILQDESGSVKVMVDSSADLLRDCAVKDILRIHRVWALLKHEIVIDLCVGRGGTHVILWSSEEGQYKEKYSSSSNFTMTDIDRNRVKSLRTFGKTIVSYFPCDPIEMRRESMLHSALRRLNENSRPLPREIQTMKTKKCHEDFVKVRMFKSLREMSSSNKDCLPNDFFSCFAQVISVQETSQSNCIVLTVWDANELCFSNNPGRITPAEMRGTLSSGGPLVNEVVSEMSVDVFCFGSINCGLGRTLKFGDVILLGVAGFITYDGRIVLSLQTHDNSIFQRGDLVKVPSESEFGFKFRNMCNTKLDSLLAPPGEVNEGNLAPISPNSNCSDDSFFHNPAYHSPSQLMRSPAKGTDDAPRSILKKPRRSLSYDSFLDGPSLYREVSCPPVPTKRVSFVGLANAKQEPLNSSLNHFNEDNTVAQSHEVSRDSRVLQSTAKPANVVILSCLPERMSGMEGQVNHINLKCESNISDSEDDSVFKQPFVPKPRTRLSCKKPSTATISTTRHLRNVKEEPLNSSFNHFNENLIAEPSHDPVTSNKAPTNSTSNGTGNGFLTVSSFGVPVNIKREVVQSEDEVDDCPPHQKLPVVKHEAESDDDSVFLRPVVPMPRKRLRPLEVPSHVPVTSNKAPTNSTSNGTGNGFLTVSSCGVPVNIKREVVQSEDEVDDCPPHQKLPVVKHEAESDDDSVFLRPVVPMPRKRLRPLEPINTMTNVASSSSPGRKEVTDRKRKLSGENVCPYSSTSTGMSLRSSSKQTGTATRRSILKPPRSLSHDSFLDGPSTSKEHRRLSVPSKKVRFDGSSSNDKSPLDGPVEAATLQPLLTGSEVKEEVVPDSQVMNDMPSTSGISLFDSRNPTMSFLLHMVRWKTMTKAAEQVLPFEMTIGEEASKILQRAEGEEFLLINWFPIDKKLWLQLFTKSGTSIVWTGYCPVCNSEPRLPSNIEGHKHCLVCRKAGQPRNERIFKCRITIPYKCSDKYLLFYVSVDELLRGMDRYSEENLHKYRQDEHAEELIDMASSYEIHFNTAVINRTKPTAMHVFANNAHVRLPL